MAVQYADANSDRPVEYVDDAQIYEDDHTSNNQESYGDDDAGGYSQEMKDYYHNHIDASDRHSGQDGIWWCTSARLAMCSISRYIILI